MVIETAFLFVDSFKEKFEQFKKLQVLKFGRSKQICYIVLHRHVIVLTRKDVGAECRHYNTGVHPVSERLRSP